MRPRLPPVLIVAAAAVTLVLLAAGMLAACSGADDWSSPRADVKPLGALGQGFTTAPPSPEATITPLPGSWAKVHPSKGYRVVLITAGRDRPTKTLVKAVSAWAEDEDLSLKTIRATRPADYIPRIQDAMALKPHLVISAGQGLVDPLTAVTANHLDQQFLVVGAELAEPTANVTAADWAGASYRGEGLDTSSAYDPATFTPERSARAVRAGVAAVLTGLTGIVVQLS